MNRCSNGVHDTNNFSQTFNVIQTKKNAHKIPGHQNAGTVIVAIYRRRVRCLYPAAYTPYTRAQLSIVPHTLNCRTHTPLQAQADGHHTQHRWCLSTTLGVGDGDAYSH